VYLLFWIFFLHNADLIKDIWQYQNIYFVFPFPNPDRTKYVPLQILIVECC